MAQRGAGDGGGEAQPGTNAVPGDVERGERQQREQLGWQSLKLVSLQVQPSQTPQTLQRIFTPLKKKNNNNKLSLKAASIRQHLTERRGQLLQAVVAQIQTEEMSQLLLDQTVHQTGQGVQLVTRQVQQLDSVLHFLQSGRTLSRSKN